MKHVARPSGSQNSERSIYDFTNSHALGNSIPRILVYLIIIFGFGSINTLSAQEIKSKPESIKVYADNQTISIEARTDIDYLELWDVSKSKRRMKFKPNKQSIKVNTQRLKKSDYQIVLFFGNDTKLIKFTI